MFQFEEKPWTGKIMGDHDKDYESFWPDTNFSKKVFLHSIIESNRREKLKKYVKLHSCHSKDILHDCREHQEEVYQVRKYIIELKTDCSNSFRKKIMMRLNQTRKLSSLQKDRRQSRKNNRKSLMLMLILGVLIHQI